MVYVAGGTFKMGAQKSSSSSSNYDSEAWDEESPVHSVTLSSYYMGETEVTQALWKAVMGNNPSYFKGEDLPVVEVSWKDICGEDGKGTDPSCFLYKLNRLTGLTFRLPTEAEWEYAARGGNKSRGYKYSGSSSIYEVAWCNDRKLHPVKGNRANELGLYDMSGNVWEWCSDRKGSYSSGSQTNPQGPSKGSSRVSRGGSWYVSSRSCRVSHRSSDAPSRRDSSLGFRLVLCP